MISIAYDPLDPIHSVTNKGSYQLTNIEVAITNRCNLRCEHCGVGNLLSEKETRDISLQALINRLDEISTLKTLNITGGEPFSDLNTIQDYVVPLLKYAKLRGLITQMNSNLTLDIDRYLPVIDLIDVVHISFNYTKYEDFYQIAFAKKNSTINYDSGKKLYENLCNNTRNLAERGVFITAETVISNQRLDSLSKIHSIVADLGVKRHELQTLFLSGFTSSSQIPSKIQIIHAIDNLIKDLDPNVWLLIGCLPVYECSPEQSEREFLKKLKNISNISIRNCPDGRNRLNVNAVSGEVYATDLANVSCIGNISCDNLVELHDDWQHSEIYKKYSCLCIDKSCTGPCMAVAKMYYPENYFKDRKITSL